MSLCHKDNQTIGNDVAKLLTGRDEAVVLNEKSGLLAPLVLHPQAHLRRLQVQLQVPDLALRRPLHPLHHLPPEAQAVVGEEGLLKMRINLKVALSPLKLNQGNNNFRRPAVYNF